MRQLAACLVAMSAVALVRPAQGDDTEQAANLFAEGRALLEHKDVQGACDKFAQAEHLAPRGAGILVNLGLCEEQLGRAAAAYGHLQRAVEVLPPSDDRRPFALDHANALRGRLAFLQITLAPTAPASAQIMLDGRTVDPRDLGRELPLDPASHTVDVRAVGHPDRHYALSLHAGEVQKVAVDAEPVSPAPASSSAPSSSEPAGSPAPPTALRTEERPPSSLDGRALLTYGLAGVAVVGLGVGTYFEVSGWSKRSALDGCKGSAGGCTQGTIDDARHTMLAGDISLGVGVATAAAAAYLYFTRPRETLASSRAPRPAVAFAPRAGGATMIAAWSF